MHKNNSNLKIRFIISSKSGKDDQADDLERAINKAFAEAGCESPNIVITQHEAHITEAASEWAERFGSEGLVYICGGDGALNECASALYQTECSMGLIPTGTGNDFAKTLYNTRYESEILDKVIKASTKPHLRKIDLIEINNEEICVNALSLGFDTIILEGAYGVLNKWPKLGKVAYLISVFKNLFARKNFNYKYSFFNNDGKEYSGKIKASVAVMANGQFYGSGFRPAPDAKLDDGLANLLFGENINALDVIKLVNKYKEGTHLSHAKIHSFEFNRGYIESLDEEVMGNIDGRIFESKRIEFKVLDKQLSFAFLDI